MRRPALFCVGQPPGVLDALMAKKQSTLSVALRATGALFSNLHIVIPLAGVLGILVAALDIAVLQILAPGAMGSAGVDQGDLLAIMLGWWGVIIAVEILLGPIAAAMPVRVLL